MSSLINHFAINADIRLDSMPKKNEKYPLACPIYIMVDSYCYPNAEWDDFAITILYWWLEKIVQLENGLASHAELLFMDGPFEVHLDSLADELLFCKVKYFSRQYGGVFEPVEHLCSIRQIKEETLLASRHLLLSLQKVDYWDDDCGNLKALVEKASDKG